MAVEREMFTKKILYALLAAGTVAVTASSPYFSLHLNRNLSGAMKGYRTAVKKEKLDNAFFYMRRKGYLTVEKVNHQIYIALTEEGKKRAGRYAALELRLRKPKKWDGKWRIVIFDIPNATRITREALRGKLIEFGFRKLQQSIWIFPYECDKEIRLLREFFGLQPRQLQLIVADRMEEEAAMRKLFRLPQLR